MRAIDTAYAGCLFRSRTEARWAVFFDALGVKWEHEREGFELPSGRYLPDFWLPDWNAWFEVKGELPTSAEWALADELALHTQRPVVFGVGTPGGPPDGKLCWGHLLDCALVEDTDTGRFHLTVSPGTKDPAALSLLAFGPVDQMFSDLDDEATWTFVKRNSSKRLEAAFKAARSARFEFGQGGRPDAHR